MNKMYVIVVQFLGILSCSTPAFAQENAAIKLKSYLHAYPITMLPYKFKRTDYGTKPAQPFPEGFSAINYNDYKDFNGTIFMPPKALVDSDIFRYFKPEGKGFLIVVAQMGKSGFKQLLVTVDTNGNYIDQLEVGIGEYSKYKTTSKQWKIDENLHVFVCQIRSVRDKPITWSEYFKLNQIKGYRIDTYYQIDSTGQFRKSREITYLPSVYSRSFFDEPGYLWDSKDNVVSDKEYKSGLNDE